MTTTLDPPPIRLRRRTSSTSQTPGPLPIPTSVAATQEPTTDFELQDLETQTSFVFEVAETQTATHPVAETQEIAPGIEVESKEIETPVTATQYPVTETQKPVTHSMDETQEPAMAETQETATAETQEPAADIQIELQELEAQTSFAVEVAETQSATHPVAATQEPVTDVEIEFRDSQTQDAATPFSSSKMTEEPEIDTHDLETPGAPAETQRPAADIDIEI